jgi:hypothetical protein
MAKILEEVRAYTVPGLLLFALLSVLLIGWELYRKPKPNIICVKFGDSDDDGPDLAFPTEFARQVGRIMEAAKKENPHGLKGWRRRRRHLYQSKRRK